MHKIIQVRCCCRVSSQAADLVLKRGKEIKLITSFKLNKDRRDDKARRQCPTRRSQHINLRSKVRCDQHRVVDSLKLCRGRPLLHDLSMEELSSNE